MRTQTLPSLLDRLFLDFEAGVPATPAARSTQPRVDLLEDADHYEVVMDVPGASQESIQVEFEDGALEIRGERVQEPTPEAGRLLRRERVAGPFARRIRFGDDVNVDAIEANVREGVLRVQVPKSEATRPRTIPVAVH